MVDHRVDGPAPGQAEQVAVADQRRDRPSGGLGHLVADLLGRSGGVGDHAALQPEGLRELVGQPAIDRARALDLDLDDAAAARVLEQPGDLEPAQVELLGDVDLGGVVQVVATGDLSQQLVVVFAFSEQLSPAVHRRPATNPSPVILRHRNRSGLPAASGSQPLVSRSAPPGSPGRPCSCSDASAAV